MKTPALVLALTTLLAFAPASRAGAPAELERSALGALSWLFARDSRAVEANRHAVAVLVVPEVKKIGLGLAVQSGTAVLFRNMRPAAYLNFTGFSLGLEAGVQEFSRAIFFTSEEALDSFYLAGGFEAGAVAGLVLADGILGSNLSTSGRSGAIPFWFRRNGLMLTCALQATKFTEYSPGG